MITERLSDTANGTMTGKMKISLERYVQAAYFSMIVEQANRRLTKMSHGRYELLVRKEMQLSAKAGLDLDVYDYRTGKARAVSSLSGGESFQAALSLALGVSDIVQQFSGGIRIETVFVDEGFGNLDEQALETALQALFELAKEDRTVGIISHVESLKTRIDSQIQVEKKRVGSCVLY